VKRSDNAPPKLAGPVAQSAVSAEQILSGATAVRDIDTDGVTARRWDRS